MSSDEHTKPDTPRPKRSISPAGGIARVVPEPDLFAGDISDETFAGQSPPPLMADTLRPPDLASRSASEQAHWRVLRTIEAHARSAHERGRQIEVGFREHRAEFAEHCLENKTDRVEFKSALTDMRNNVALSGIWGKVFTGLGAGATFFGAIAGAVLAIAGAAKSCSEPPREAEIRVHAPPIPSAAKR